MTRQMTLCQAADCLEIDSWRVLRLGRFLNLNPYVSVIPGEEVDKIRLLTDPDDRYTMLRDLVMSYTSAPR